MAAWPQFVDTERFHIERPIGSGSFGHVFMAFDRGRQERVALKALHRQDADSLYRLKREFRALADLTHRNLVQLYELISDGRRWFFTLEFVDGTDFISYVRRDGVCQEDKLRRSVAQLCEGLLALHRAGKMHRDIKPSNVLVTHDGRVVLLDFGLVKEIGLASSVDRKVLGTPYYMAPEQAAAGQVEEPADWYAVGVMLYEALTGRWPHEGDLVRVLSSKQTVVPRPPASIDPGLPRDLNDLCMELLAIDPRRRPPGPAVLDRVLGRAEGSSLPEREPAPLFVGREAELDRLRSAFSLSRRGQAAVVHVRGPSGMGKTVLVQRFVEAMAERNGAIALVGKCYEQESVPYKGVDSLIDALGAYLVELDQLAAAALMPRGVEAAARLFPVLLRVEAIAKAPPRPGAGDPSPQELRDRGFAALRELLARLADRTPLVLYLDDLQWGDMDSALLLSEVLRPPDPPALLLILGYRSGDGYAIQASDELSPAHATDVIEIGPLSPEAAGELVQARLGIAAGGLADEELIESVVREASGNPLFLDELVRHVSRAAVPRRLEGELHLEEVLLARIAELPAAARTFLESVAVAGQPIAEAVVAEAAGLGAGRREIVAELRAGHLLRATGGDGGRVEVFHDRVRETLVSHLSAAARVDHHRRLARVLEASGTAENEALARHCQESGQREKAGRYLLAAASDASAALAFDRAASFYERALALTVIAESADVPAIRASLGRALADAGRGVAAAEAYLRAAKGATPEQAVDYRRMAGVQLLASGRVDEAWALIRDLLPTYGIRIPKGPTGALVTLLWSRARLRIRGYGYRLRPANEVSPAVLHGLEVACALASALSMDAIRGSAISGCYVIRALETGEATNVCAAFLTEAALHALEGVPGRKRAEVLLAKSREIADEMGEPVLDSAVSMTTAMVAHYTRMRLREAVASYDRAIEIWGELPGMSSFDRTACQFMANEALFWLGDLAEISRRVPSILRDARKRGDLFAQVAMIFTWGQMYWLAADRIDEFEQIGAEAGAAWTQSGFMMPHAWAELARIQVHLYRGEAGAAKARLDEYWKRIYRATKYPQAGRIECWFMRGRVNLALARQRGAAEAQGLLREVGRCARRLRREHIARGIALSFLLEAGSAATRGAAETAVDFLARAEDRATRDDMSLMVACARYRRGRLVGGDKGRLLVNEAEAFMRRQGVVNSERMLALLAPGF